MRNKVKGEIGVRTVFLYAGQGSQTVGMGKDFYEEFEEYREFIDSIDADDRFKHLMHEGPLEELSKTENTQGCMAMFAAGVTKLLLNRGIKPDMAGGLSLGEYGALYAAGVFDEKEYVNITAFRGKEMAKAAHGLNCSMSAILGTDGETVRKSVDEYYKAEQENGDNANIAYVTVANYNCPGQYVICGDNEAVEKVEEIVKTNGAKRCVRLNVSGPFHTKYMSPAGDALNEYFSKMTFNEPKIPVVLNYTGDFYKPGDDLKELLVCQVQNSVHMEEDFRALINAGADNFIEIGPGNVLTGFLKKTAKSMGVSVNVTSISSVDDFNNFINQTAE